LFCSYRLVQGRRKQDVVHFAHRKLAWYNRSTKNSAVIVTVQPPHVY
jgi:hypothetical protein